MIHVGEQLRPFLERKIGRTLTPHAQFVANQVGMRWWIVALDAYRAGCSVELHSAGDRGALSRKFIRYIAELVWTKLDVQRITGLVRADNADALETNDRLGFVREGVMRKALDGQDIVIFGMLRDECRWLPREKG